MGWIMQASRMMQGLFSLLLVVMLALAMFSIVQAGEQRTDVGEVERVQERARAIYDKQSRHLAAGAPVWFEDLLKTGRKARLKAVLKDESVVTLGEKAELLVDEFVYDPGERKGNLALRVAKGAFLFVGGKIEAIKDSKVQITTPAGILGISGTTVWGGPIDTGYGILVLAGEVTVTTPAGRVVIPAGRGTMIYSPDRKPLTPFVWDQAKTDRAVATISFRD
jgi:hypothetical protein